jgi:hypothetical protein
MAPAVALEKRCVAAVGHEADLVAVRLVGDRQPELARLRAHGRLVEIADREHRVRQLLLIQRKEKVRLILGGIGAAFQPVAAGGRIEIDTCVVSRRHEVGAEALGAGDERGKFQIAVAVHARNGRASGRVLAHEIRDDGVGKLALEIDDVVRDADACGDTPGVVEVVDRAAGAEAARLETQAPNCVGTRTGFKPGFRG